MGLGGASRVSEWSAEQMASAGSSSTEKLGPQWLAHRFEEGGDNIHFVDHDRAARAGVPFLTDVYLPPAPPKVIHRPRALALAPPTAPIHFIFHSGFCCSTLLAACLDQPGLATGFSEPMLLNDVVGWRKRGAQPPAVERLLDDSLSLLARPFSGDAAAIIKPSTILNGLAPAILKLRPGARAIVIHAPLADFVTSIAKKGLDGRLWARDMFLNLRREGLVQNLGFDDEAFFGQSDLQIAAIGWLAQQAQFAALVAAYPDRVRSVTTGSFLGDPTATLRSAGTLFGLAVSDDQVGAAMAGPLRRNSKDKADYGADQRTADYAAARDIYGDEIAKVAAWAEAVAGAAGVPLALPNPLT